jgi:hypothetical protein
MYIFIAGRLLTLNFRTVKMQKVLNFTYLRDDPYSLMYSCVCLVLDATKGARLLSMEGVAAEG